MASWKILRVLAKRWDSSRIRNQPTMTMSRPIKKMPNMSALKTMLEGVPKKKCSVLATKAAGSYKPECHEVTLCQ
jgi:hypothetical protein